MNSDQTGSNHPGPGKMSPDDPGTIVAVCPRCGSHMVETECMPELECIYCGHQFSANTKTTRVAPESYFSAEDYAWIETLSLGDLSDEWDGFGDAGLTKACIDLATLILNSEPALFEQWLERYEERTRRLCGNYELFRRLMLLGLEYGVACLNGDCANYLGAQYYIGEFVEQDYVRAEELYRLADSQGSAQATINLGYIYEYGRTAKPDYMRAYMQYAKAAALYSSPEALYKLGDMYSRGKLASRDIKTAFKLYCASYDAAATIEMQAQAALRMANLIGDFELDDPDIPHDYMRALQLYQIAELGLRKDIDRGLIYYKKRLQEAIAGQEAMRKMLEGAGKRIVLVD